MRIFLFLAMAILASGNALGQNPRVELKTTRGDIVVELYADKAPRTVANFLQYVKDGFYNGTIFHRVIDGFMVQGGGFDRDMHEKPKTRPPIENEAANRVKNEVGTIAMARTPNPHSATAQFFINLKDNDFLNYREPTRQGYGYAVFGKVTRGMDVVNTIAKVATGNAGPHQNVPREPIIIESATVNKGK
ncbi:MAG: peptidyl-prolyl cis-trans isomerase A [Betaproteobacteria bacterium RIFCSPLOWO2_12_FULL_63_13]|nr:MAG: peptidyl-prolyl cis-trans isomerase A [Betaproteobacteria bacterium RIFCSPLOWO2_02_FULL_63_19]OGA51642.1 MAG: peptidyl-prolyl cis-trans isomerase A [Betaproteobacteria bacterium RIFCSPLOWO2_12_FULL_63_13]